MKPLNPSRVFFKTRAVTQEAGDITWWELIKLTKDELITIPSQGPQRDIYWTQENIINLFYPQ